MSILPTGHAHLLANLMSRLRLETPGKRMKLIAAFPLEKQSSKQAWNLKKPRASDEKGHVAKYTK